MTDLLREKYFLLIKLVLIILFNIYGTISLADKSGVSIKILLLVSFYIGAMSIKEFVNGKKKLMLLLVAFAMSFLLIRYGGRWYILLTFLCIYEFLSLFPNLNHGWYYLPIIGVLFDSPIGALTMAVILFMTSILYIQQNFVVKGYENRMEKDLETELNLKKDMRLQEYKSKLELKQNLLNAENQILEERAALSQKLHDKLGHNINGSIYQLEGVKVLMDKDPIKSKDMIQAVINQLRGGMDEIRAILRRERPEKKKYAMLQLNQLCEDCNNKGVEAEMSTTGDISLIPDKIWEVILDNAYEAVSNSMKYSGCKRISIVIVVMNKVIRCTIEDDGKGCQNIEDGMGISGMRQRVRSVGGTLSFESEIGFSVSMILPIG